MDPRHVLYWLLDPVKLVSLGLHGGSSNNKWLETICSMVFAFQKPCSLIIDVTASRTESCDLLIKMEVEGLIESGMSEVKLLRCRLE